MPLTCSYHSTMCGGHSVTISELQLTTTNVHLLPRHCRHSGVKLPLRCRRRRHLQQSSCVVSHCPGVNFLPPHAPPHTACRWSTIVLPACRAEWDQTPSPASRRWSVVLSAYTPVYTVIKGKLLSPLQGSYQPSRETSTGHLSLATGNITLHPTLHIMSKCCTWTESGPKKCSGTEPKQRWTGSEQYQDPDQP